MLRAPCVRRANDRPTRVLHGPGWASGLRAALTDSQKAGSASAHDRDAEALLATRGKMQEELKVATVARSLHDVVLHLRGCYVSKAAILRCRHSCAGRKSKSRLNSKGLDR